VRVGVQLSRQAIVDGAIEIADAEGLSAVTMRRLAARLDTRVMSIYTYVASKEDLLDLMFDEIARRTSLRDRLPGDWKDALRTIAHRVRELGLQHPWTVDVLGQHVQIGPNTLRLLDEWMATLTPLALPAGRAWRIVTAVNDYVTGYVVREGAQRRVVPVDDDQASRWHRELGAYLTTMADTGELPHIAELLRNGFARNDDNFTHGLNWLIDSIAAAHPPPELDHTD
jgi:AcrR family transcriptional regulator